jgi:hypothetical protein
VAVLNDCNHFAADMLGPSAQEFCPQNFIKLNSSQVLHFLSSLFYCLNLPLISSKAGLQERYEGRQVLGYASRIQTANADAAGHRY